jgi:hypothetical protein
MLPFPSSLSSPDLGFLDRLIFRVEHTLAALIRCAPDRGPLLSGPGETVAAVSVRTARTM